MSMYDPDGSFLTCRSLLLFFAMFSLLLLLPMFRAQQTTAAPESFGTWTSTLIADPSLGSVDFKTDVTVGLELGGWEMRTRTVIERGAWRQQNVTVLCTFGQVDVKSDLRLEPHLTRFRDWITRLRWTGETLTFTVTPKLTRTTNWLIVEADHASPSATINSQLRLRAPTGSCSLSFYDAAAERCWQAGDAKIQIKAILDANGIPKLIASTSGLQWDAWPWASLSAEVVRTITATSLTAEVDLLPMILLDDKDLRLALTLAPSREGLFAPCGISKAVMTACMADWRANVTVYPHASDWIEKTYFLECKTRGSLGLAGAGSLTIDIVSLWTTTAPGKMTLALTHKPCAQRTFALQWALDLPHRSLDALSLLVQIEW